MNKIRVIKNKKRLANYLAEFCGVRPIDILAGLESYELDKHLTGDKNE